MKSLPNLRSIARFCAWHPWRVVLLSIVLLVALGGFAATNLTKVVSNDLILTTDFESVVGSRILRNSSLADSANLTEIIVVRSLDGTTTDQPAFRQHVDDVVGAVRALQGEWEGTGPLPAPSLQDLASGETHGATVLNYYEVQDAIQNPLIAQAAQRSGSADQINALVSQDHTGLIIPVTFNGFPTSITQYIDTVERFDSGAFDVTTIGNLSINQEYQDVVARDLITAETFGIPMAVAVLVIVFGSLIAPLIPFVLGIFSVGIALGVVTLYGQFGDLQLFIQNMVTMLGLAIGIDYSLFIVERFREQRALGYPKEQAIEIAAATSGKAVVFSGITVILAMIGVMFVRLNIFFSLSVGAITVVAIALLLTATLLPALLSLLGDRIDWPRKSKTLHEPITTRNMYTGFWGRITKVVVERPWMSLMAALAFLLILTLPVLDMRIGFSRSSQLPEGEIRDAYNVLSNDFSAGLLSPMEIVFTGANTDQDNAAIQGYLQRMRDSGDFVQVSDQHWDDTNSVAVVTATLDFEASSDRAYETIDTMRTQWASETIGQQPDMDVYVTGQSAGEADMSHHVNQMLPVVIAFVLSLSFILLTLAFRSIVVSLTSLLLNLLSVGASWGIMVAVFSKGILRDFLGYNASPVIEMWLPILMFCVLFGLSMDYHVFILSRIREHYDISHDNHESVAIGLRSTGRIITGAAMIMVVVFFTFSRGSMLAIQQMGFGLGVAVLLDATIIRSVLVPAIMTLIGDRNWYLPRWLNWLPDLRIEGDASEHEPPRVS